MTAGRAAADRDARFMRRALDLAERARGLTSPNPLVGAVVVCGDAIVGEGHHRAAGQPHAEVEALEAAGERSRGATLYVTLEPCTHHGRTPPCVPRVVAAGVARAVVAVGDPNPMVAGRGIAALAAAGIAVTDGVMADVAQRQNRAFLLAMREGRPHVTLKGAITLDGKIADAHGTSRWITGTEARERAHRLRAESDAIVVGVETVLRDDPELTVRLGAPWPREPYRVVLDSRARTPPSARLLGAGSPGRVLVAVAGPPASNVARLQARGAAIVTCPGPDGRVDPRALLAELHRREVRAVLVEGGGEVEAAFLDAGLVDRVAVFLAPALLGGRAAPSLVGGAGRALKDRVVLEGVEISRVGQDLLIEADVMRAAG
jgi:diaminohydroxyphosphoribosylaminopyrimidine deaminase / 5-amino-6-(5-phosphoribosylamino)uracil reductase